MEWSIQNVARLAGTTSRTLRHYGERGLLQPIRVGSNGYRYYDQDCLVRLQRILLLRELGLGLPAIAEVLQGQRDPAAALGNHLKLLEFERQRIGRQIESVKTTLRKIERGEQLMVEEAFDGFDHTQYEQEVTERWGPAVIDVQAWDMYDWVTKRIARKLTPNGTDAPGRTRGAAEAQVRGHKPCVEGGLGSTYQQSF